MKNEEKDLLALWAQRPLAIDYDNTDHLTWNNRLLLAVKALIPTIKPTTQSPATVPIAPAETPSNAEPTSPEAASSNHTQAPILNTADTAASPDHKSDSAGTSASVAAKLAAAKRESAKRGPQASKRVSKKKPAPRATPPATVAVA